MRRSLMHRPIGRYRHSKQEITDIIKRGVPFAKKLGFSVQVTGVSAVTVRVRVIFPPAFWPLVLRM